MALHPSALSAGLLFAAACAGSPTPTHDNTADAGASSSDAGAEQKPWIGALGALGALTTATYSFSFADAPPAGTRLRFGLHLVEPASACGRYGSGSAPARDRDFWFLEVDLSGAVTGDYSVTTDRLSSHGGRAASVNLLHRRDGEFVERYPSLAGTIDVASVPTLEAFAGGAGLRATIDLAFATHAMQALECRGGQGPAAPAAPTTCACVDDSGLRSECTLRAGREQCCFDEVTERRSFHVEVDATPCAAMCRSVAGLPDYCGSLEPR